MTKKDFELIANILKGARFHNASLFDALSQDFADALKGTNKQFNRDKFLRACGVRTTAVLVEELLAEAD